MKKCFSCIALLLLVAAMTLPVFAVQGNVSYEQNAKEFVFSPGSSHSPTDLFADFKSVMPGDSLTQKITVKNNADRNVKVKIYLRSLGAHEESEAFLSGLSLCVKKSEENHMPYMFDAAANETEQLSDWVCLGTLYSGGEVNLDVILQVPVDLGNEYSGQIGFLDWEFMVEEFPVEENDPKPPATGDSSCIGVWMTLGIVSAFIMLLVIFWRKKEQKQETAVL